jgi:hypothetical protein
MDVRELKYQVFFKHNLHYTTQLKIWQNTENMSQEVFPANYSKSENIFEFFSH